MDAFLKREFGVSEEPEGEEAYVQGFLRECLKSDTPGEAQYPKYDSIVPKPGFCVKTKTENQEKFFINVCVSERVPEPKDIDEAQLEQILQSFDPSQYRVPISIGEPHAEVDNSGRGCTVCDVVINPAFLGKAENSETFEGFLVSLAIEAVESKYSLSLSREWLKLKNRKFMGKLQEQCVRTTAKPWIHDVDDDRLRASSLISDMPADSPSKGSTSAAAKGKLGKEPKYTIYREPVDGDVPEFLVAEIQLPEIKSASSFTLDVGEDRMLLQTRSQLYHLDLYLPFNINQEECGAQFDRRTHVLSITMPVAVA